MYTMVRVSGRRSIVRDRGLTLLDVGLVATLYRLVRCVRRLLNSRHFILSDKKYPYTANHDARAPVTAVESVN